MRNLVQVVITSEFNRRVGKNQPSKALRISFASSLDYDKEDGYRYLDLLIWAPMNYVAVLARRRWNVIPVAWLEVRRERHRPWPRLYRRRSGLESRCLP